ncbi:MAG: histidine--tRNA ligase [Flavobacteriales bacterium]|nr:histidine--tRNA ligase [Flavobacteriales bacterium]
MSQQKPSAPKGMRDFGPEEMARRNYIFSTIRRVYEKFGFSPIETPAMEKLETLTGKYGEEGDRLIFKVLNSGDYLKEPKVSGLDLNQIDSKKLLRHISEKALRYDLTVPFARYVVQYHHQLPIPFKRYQIQPVWRADNPQKGRYREFYQCDADVVGSASLINEVELILILHEVLTELKIQGFKIYINNRKILAGIAEVAGISKQLVSFTVALDKLDKIGKENVLHEMQQNGFSEDSLKKISQVIDAAELKKNTLSFLKKFLSSSETGMKGMDEVSYVIKTAHELGVSNETLELDITLARGLDYYTGCIFEVKVPGSGFGSIAGGGRYDDLTGIFGMPGLPGVGISFGADRIYDLLLAHKLYPSFESTRYKYFFLNFGETESKESLRLIQILRGKNIRCGIYPDAVKIKKQMEYADKVKAEYVCTIGSNELLERKLGIKNMHTGEQHTISWDEFIQQITQEA